jgi:APA family basic amino acid/polyamine antiporter
MQNPRAFLALAEDRALPGLFGRVNSRTQVQEFTLVFFTATILLSIFLLGHFENIVGTVIFIDSLNIAVVASTVFVLRRKAAPGTEAGTARAPLYPFLPAVFVLFLFGMSVNVLLTQPKNALAGAAFFLTGLPVFLVMRRLRAGGKG